jgi:hypothetical protein
MQVHFGEHDYLFVNPRYQGQYFPPSEGTSTGRWFNYGGDKVWPLPEGTGDEQHWPGPVSDLLDDGDYAFQILARGPRCLVRLDGPPDPRTGLEYSREIGIDGDSPEISFHTVMRNASAHPIEWSMQTVSQYDTSDPRHPAKYNHDFWAFTPAHPQSAYPNQYLVRSGLPSDPSFSVKDGLFTLHWLYLQSEVWVDSPGSWLAVVDGSTNYAMIERFSIQTGAEYPGHASVIFYKNGPPPGSSNANANAGVAADSDDLPFYLEAEINSPMVRLEPGATYRMDTKWLPTRMGSKFKGVMDPGVVGQKLQATATPGGVVLSGRFGVFYAGQLIAHLYDEKGMETAAVVLQSLRPTDPVSLDREIKVPPKTVRLSLHLVDSRGNDRGSLGEVHIVQPGSGS